jgi:hypothetical protein
MAQLAAKTTDDRKHVHVEWREDGKPIGHILLTAAEVERHIHAMAEHRENLAEDVIRKLDPGKFRLHTVADPIWHSVTTEMDNGGVTVALRHPGLGWLGFAFPPSAAAALGKLLMERANPQAQAGSIEPAGD